MAARKAKAMTAISGRSGFHSSPRYGLLLSLVSKFERRLAGDGSTAPGMFSKHGFPQHAALIW